MIEAWTVTWKSPNHLYVHCCGVLWFDQSNLQMRIRAESTLYLTGENFSINSFIWNFSVVGECDLVFLIVSDTGGKAEWMLAQVTSAWPEGTYSSWLNVILDNCRRRSSVVRAHRDSGRDGYFQSTFQRNNWILHLSKGTNHLRTDILRSSGPPRNRTSATIAPSLPRVWR